MLGSYFIESLLIENTGNPAALWSILKRVTRNNKKDTDIRPDIDGKH